MVVLAVGWLNGIAVAEDVRMPQFGHQTITVSADAPVTFYDMNGYTGISSSSSNNSFATTIFQPAEDGNSIKIDFENVDVRNDGSSWPANLSVYNGVFDVTSVDYPTSTSGVTGSSAFPANAQLLDKLDGTYTNLSYVSSDATGALSVCYVYRYAKAIQGWKATVSSVTLSAMTIQSASGDNSMVDGSVWAGKEHVAVAGMAIQTEGYSSPEKLHQVTFTVSGSNVIDPTALKLYAGQAASTSTLSELAGTVTETAGVYTYTLTNDYALSNGSNLFCLGGDVLPTAPFNATAQVTVTAVATVGGATAFTPAEAVTLTVEPMYLMATDATYTIDDEVSFYDEGGKDGHVIKGFDGKVVFEPAASGKKVQLTFKSINVFYTDYAASSTGYVDIIKVYNGNSTAAADLLWEITQADASSNQDIVIKSTAADGKLTITHKNNVSYDSNLRDGWSAIVSQFTPQAMTIVGVDVVKATGTLSAGSEKNEILRLNIRTENTEPALVVEQMTLTTNGTYPQLSKARLYYTGASDELSTYDSHLIGEAEVTADAVTLTATNSFTFREGDNYLWLTYDIATMAENDKTVDAIVSAIDFTNGSHYNTVANPDGQLHIKNVAIQACGTQNITIAGEWEYTHTVASEYNSKYMYENCDQTIVFAPAHEGQVVQIDYQDFDVYYASSTYGTRAKYIVYAGEGTTGEVLWQLDANGKQPAQIRSTAADGKLTVVFNPNTTSSYYTGNGWHATVSEYELRDMAVDTIVVAQANNDIVKLGEPQAAILTMDITTQGTLNVLALEQVAINTKESSLHIDSVFLVQDDAIVARAGEGEEYQLVLPTPLTLNEYSNVFTVAVQVSEAAEIDAAIDLAITSVTISGEEHAVAGDPEGVRIVKNVMNMAEGNNGTITIGENSLILYDDGGKDENYTSNMSGYITFVPAGEGYAVELVFKDFDIAYLSGDPFRIYYGNTYDSEATPDKKYGMYSKPAENESVVSRAEDGSITLFVQMPSSRMRGFEVEVRQHLLTDLAIDSVVVVPSAPAEATKGTGDIRLMQAAVYVSGDRTPITLTGFDMTASDLLVDRHIYATGHSATFATNNEFTDSYEMSESGVYYFWFVGSIDAAAEIGDEVSLQLLHVVCGEEQTAATGAATINVVSGAHGYYEIGSGATADYATLTAALQAIAQIGMDGPVVLAVENGTYTEQVVVPEISGAGAANTLTIRSVTGNYNDVTYQYNNTLTGEQGVFTIDGADYVTLRGLSFTSTFTSNQSPAVVIVKNAATHVTIDSCRIYAAQYSEYTSRMDLLHVDAGENHYNNDFALTNSVLDGGYMGLNVSGHKAAADALQSNMLIRGNNFRNQGTQMIYGDAVSNLRIIGNTFRGQVKKSTTCAIDWLLIGDTATIADNDILLTATASDNQNFQALYFRPNSYQDKENAVLYLVNNVINAQNASSYATYAINLNSNLPKLLLVHNTMVLASEGTASSPVYIQSAPVTGSRFVNNIFQSQSKGYAIRYKNAGSINNITFEHNVLYTPESTFGMPTANVGTFADWKTAVGATDEQGNLNEGVVFASANLLIPRETNEGHLLTAAAGMVDFDITGKERAAQPTIGAYEYDSNLFRIPVMAEDYPMVTNVQDHQADIVLHADNIGTAYVLVLPAESAQPDAATIMAEGAETTLALNADIVCKATDLSEETSYMAYIVMLSPLGESADTVLKTDLFTTAWTLRPVELNTIAQQQVAVGTELVLTATLLHEYEQAKPYSYEWRTAFDATIIGNEATLNVTTRQTTEYICLVTDKFGQQAVLSAHVWVNKAASGATFEEYVLAEGTNKYVDDAWVDNTETYLYSGSYAFANTPNKAWSAFNGYAISSDNSTEITGNYMIDQFRSAAGGAYEGNNYAIAYYAAPSTWYAGYLDPIVRTNSIEAEAVTGFYITNTVYTLDAILHGDYANGAFAAGDYMSVTIKGYNGNELTGSVVVYLADYRSENEAEHFALDTWQWVDLSSLGAVTGLQFDMFTTKSNDYGFTTPTYFCLDNFGGAAPSHGTGIEQGDTEAVKARKVLRDGSIFILRDGKLYDLNGRAL